MAKVLPTVGSEFSANTSLGTETHHTLECLTWAFRLDTLDS